MLRRAIAEAKNADELAEIASRLRSTVVALHGARLSTAQISQVISVVADALIRRMIDFAVEIEGWPPVEFAWLQLGSHGRREPVLSSDLDSGMSWRDIPEGKEISGPRRVLAGEQTESYMHAVAEHVARTVRTLGWKLDPHGVNATGSFSASSIEDWADAITGWLSHPDHETVLIAASILLDSRVNYGDGSLNPKPILCDEGKTGRCCCAGCCGWRSRRSPRPASAATSSSSTPASTAAPSTSSTAGCCRSST